MVDQYLRDLTESLAEVKQETAGVMAEEARTDPAKRGAVWAKNFCISDKNLWPFAADDGRMEIPKEAPFITS